MKRVSILTTAGFTLPVAAYNLSLHRAKVSAADKGAEAADTDQLHASMKGML